MFRIPSGDPQDEPRSAAEGFVVLMQLVVAAMALVYLVSLLLDLLFGHG